MQPSVTSNASAGVVKVLVRLQCGSCRKFIGVPSGKSTVNCDHCKAVNVVLM